MFDRGIYQPKRRISKISKSKLTLRQISNSDYLKCFLFIVAYLVPITFLMYCLFRKPEGKNFKHKSNPKTLINNSRKLNVKMIE
jgi:hypothetical protein